MEQKHNTLKNKQNKTKEKKDGISTELRYMYLHKSEHTQTSNKKNKKK